MTKSHLKLSFGAELSIYPKYECPLCHSKLWVERSERTNWQEWLFAEGWRRHYKNRCNFQKKKQIDNYRQYPKFFRELER